MTTEMNPINTDENTFPRRVGPAAAGLHAAAVTAVAPYAAVMRLRRWMYRRGLLKRGQAGVPVICVGNITTGGTGKTPMVAWIVGQLRRMGRTPAILTRGYKAVAGKSDEAQLLEQLTGADVVIDPDRIAGASRAVAGGADVLVMDDGFQHRRLRRDMDIVLIDATNPFGSGPRRGACLPLGRLRESPRALLDAHAIVITRSDACSEQWLVSLRRRLHRAAPRASLHQAVHRPVCVITETGDKAPLDTLAGKKVFAFAGIGNAPAFFATVEHLQADIVGRRSLADHVRYDRKLLDDLSQQGRRCGTEVFLTTRKDGVKLADLSLPAPIRQLAVQMEITEGRRELLDGITRAITQQ